MKAEKVTEYMSAVNKDEDLVCVWFTKEDFPIGMGNDGDYETLSQEQWNEVVSSFERTKWDNPLTSSWTNVHQDIYKMVGDKLNAHV